MPSDYPLPSGDPASLGLAARPLIHLDRLIRRHIEEGRYPGAQIALARHGKLALFRTYGDARVNPTAVAANDDTLFLLFSQTKVLTSAAVWSLVEEGKLSPSWTGQPTTCRSSRRAAKAAITLQQVMTHQGGFPSDDVTKASHGPTMRGCAPRCATSRWNGRRAAEAAIPRPRRASGAGDGDRGGHRPGLSRT